MTRSEKIEILIELIDFVEGTIVPKEYFEEYTLERIDEKIEFYEYVAEK